MPNNLNKEQRIWILKKYWKYELSGHINRHNCVYWVHENPNFTIETQLNQPGVTD